MCRVTNLLLIDGSPRARSNTGSIVTYLAGRLKDLRATVDVFHVTSRGPSDEEVCRLPAIIRNCDAVVLATPVYFDGLPAVTHSLLERVAAVSVALSVERSGTDCVGAAVVGTGGVGPVFYGVVHSGFVEAAQRRSALWTLELFARAVGWSWQGGVSFGGTSPIDGRPLEEVGRLATVVREGLELAAREMITGGPLSAATLAACGRSPFAFLPRSVVIRLINARTRSIVRRNRIDVTALPYAD